MPQILKDTQVVSDNWILLDENADSIPNGDILLSFEQWQKSEGNRIKALTIRKDKSYQGPL